MGWEDDRGVSEVLGAILLFGIIVLAIGGYQAFIVPQQNADIEQSHDSQLKDEFIEIQESISNAAASERSRTTSLTLGTEYPVRALSLNPSPVSGSLSSGVSGEIHSDVADIEHICGLEPQTRSIQYEANYNEFRGNGKFVYENGVTYRMHDNGAVLTDTDQELFDGNTVRLFPIVSGDLSKTGTSSEQLRFVPGETGVQSVTVPAGETLNLTVPTQLGADDWDSIIDDQHDVSVSDGEATFTLEGENTFRFECTPVGIGSEPEQDDVPRDDEPEENGEEGGPFNPIGPNQLVLDRTESSTGPDASDVRAFFINTGEADKTVTEIRIPFTLQMGTDPDNVDVEFQDDSEPISVKPGSSEWESVDDWTWGSAEKYVDIDELPSQNDALAIVFRFDDGTTSTYLIST